MRTTETFQQSAPGGLAAKDVAHELTEKLARKQVAAIGNALEWFNQAAASLDSVRRLACLARRADGQTIGGALARTWGQCCELQQIWVDAAHRRRGIGRELVRHIEVGARTRGCTLMYLETFSFQAPEFYRRLGFESACELTGFPDGIVKYILRKPL